MVSLPSYLLSALELALVAAGAGCGAQALRARLLPGWGGAPARLAEAILGIGLLVLLAELLGVIGLLSAAALLVASVAIGALGRWSRRRRDVGAGGAAPAVTEPTSGVGADAPGTGGKPSPRGRDPEGTAMSLVAIAVVALVVGSWAVTAKRALDAGIFNFDSLWYHMPFAVEIAQGHSVTGLRFIDTVFANWFYPQSSELLHALGILLTGRDTLSLFVNFGWLALALLAAWCLGRPYARARLSVVAAAVLLGCHTLVVREPGAAKNDLMAAALLLAAVAIMVSAWERRPREAGGIGARELAVAGLAVGLAVGTKQTALAMAAALTLAAIALAAPARRWVGLAWWSLGAVLGGGYWYLRNLLEGGNPIPQVERIGPLSLPHPEHLQSGRPDFSVAHYATDTDVWREYFVPGLHTAFGALWPVLLGAALLGAVLAAARADRALRWAGIVALVGMLAYLVTPLSAAGPEGAPSGFGINIRYVVPALLLGIALLPMAAPLAGRRRQWGLLGALLVLLVLSDRADAVLRAPQRAFALLLALLVVIVPAVLLMGRSRGVRRGLLAAGWVALGLLLVGLGYPLQRHYLERRFSNPPAAEGIPGMGLDPAYRWARNLRGTRIGLAGTTAAFAGYGFYGPDLSNRVVYLGRRGPDGSFNALGSCRAFRAAVNAADLDYLVTSPFLNFIHVNRPIRSPEARWLRGEEAVQLVLGSGRVAVWRVRGRLDPEGCGAANAPLRELPDTPAQ